MDDACTAERMFVLGGASRGDLFWGESVSVGLFCFICIFFNFYFSLCVSPLVLILGRCSNNCKISMVACRSQILFVPGCGVTTHAKLCSSQVVGCLYVLSYCARVWMRSHRSTHVRFVVDCIFLPP